MGHFTRAGVVALVCLLPLTGGPPAVAEPPPHPQPVTGLTARVDALYRQAAQTTAQLAAARRETSTRRAAASRLHAAAQREQHRLGVLRRQAGAVASSQYRRGAWTPGAQLFTASSPHAFLRRMDIRRQGHHALGSLLQATRATQQRLQRDRARADSALRAARAAASRGTAAKHAVDQRLAHAEAALQAQQAKTVRVRHTPAGCAQAEPPPPAPLPRGATWVAPLTSYALSAGFASSGARWSSWHTGQDFAVPEGTPVRAVGAGTVYSASCGDGFGNQLVIRHANGYYSQYGHLSLLQAEPGSRVRAGQRIGLSGDTGNSSGPHLHLEIRATPHVGSGIDPVPWLRERGVTL